MHRHLFRRVDIAPHRAHMLDGTVPEAFVAAHAAEFDRWIEPDGGLDVQLLGIGRNGHIGFNEPSDLSVDRGARAAHPAGRSAPGHPRRRGAGVRRRRRGDPAALTMGVATILAARSIVMLATGSHKAEAIAAALTGPMTAQIPASLLQSAGARVTWMLDEAAAKGLA